MDYIILSIPIFFILIGVELLIAKLRKTHLYRFNDAVANISCGIAQQITVALAKTALIVGYIYLYRHFRLFEIPDTWWTWFLLFIGVDFFYYWFHRLSHEINVLWGAHIVHHQSEEYNLSVALRQSSFQGFISMIFYLPLALIGFNPVAFVTVNAFQTLYQFWIHTKLISKLHPVLEFIFNTPSHHRVHHGRNPKYIDRNHGGTLIIFDRLFGTFQKEEEEVVYGVTKPLASWNPVWANFDYYADLWATLKQPLTLGERLKLVWASPGWMPTRLGGFQRPKDVKPGAEIYNTTIPSTLNYYILAQFTVVLLITTLFLFGIDKYAIHARIILCAWILLSVMSLGGLFELRKWAFYLEIGRLLSFVVLVVAFRHQWWGGITLPGLAIAVFSLAWFLFFRKLFNYRIEGKSDVGKTENADCQ
ncbi:MAG TPA: sterol desaturase family protein [Saprospiraceae bacterium]|nr:sterol desaturase family protein [Saprospiraceae bacterium]